MERIANASAPVVIRLTNEMLEAGLDAISGWGAGDPVYWQLIEVFSAMAKAGGFSVTASYDASYAE